MPEWRRKTVEDCLVRLSLAAFSKLQTRDYRPSGRYPIIDQGQSLIAGWTDDESGLIKQNLPVVVFGDHTRAFKFVDFPFVRGADGTQVLRPKPDIDPRYFYYALRAADLPARGYNRHFKTLKEQEIPLPTTPEQNDIARVLKAVEGSLSLQDEELAAWDRCKRAAMATLFARGLRGEAQKETKIGLVPESWDVVTVGSHFSVASGGTPSRTNQAYWRNGSIPWVKTTEVNYGIIETTEEFITGEGLASSAAKLLPAGTLLMAMYGQGVTRGRVAILGIEAACNQACATINARDDEVLPSYLFHFLTYRYEAIRQMAHGGQQQNLNLEIVRDLPLTFPKGGSDQNEIVAILDAIDRKIALHKKKRAVLDDLFKSLLHKLMTGEIRVADLDLSALNPKAVAA